MSNVVFSPEQFQQLLSTVTQQLTANLQTAVPNASAVNSNVTLPSGNFSHCASRFDGAGNRDVNAFIDAIEIYKDCTHISDENAVKGLPMLLDGFAATWYQGVKATITTWQETIELLRTTFGPKKPAFRVYRELFAEEQPPSTKTDVFVCKCRAILAQLPRNTLTEEIQLDMVYGLLKVDIRKNIPRDKIRTFTELLAQARAIEETLSESEKLPPGANRDNVETQNKKPRCAFCKNLGHTKDVCRKLAARQLKDSDTDKPKVTSSDLTRNETKVTPVTPKITCYGCGTPGYIKANCPKCTRDASASSIDFSSIDFEGVNARHDEPAPKLNPRARPVLNINILGFRGTGIIDTAAKQSVAGRELYKLLRDTGNNFTPECVKLKLADGSAKETDVLLIRVDVYVYGRCVPTTFIILPEADNKTLLGIDFIADAKMILSVPSATWSFADEPDIVYPLKFEELTSRSTLTVSSCDVLRSEEGETLTEPELDALRNLLSDNPDIFEIGGEPTPYAEHAIDTGSSAPIASPPYRMSPARKEQLREELDKLLAAGTIEETESPWAAPVVLVPKKGGGIRLCVDYQKLNAVTVTDSYPLPRIDDLLHAARQTCFMTTIDLRTGYHQIKVRESDRDKTAFVTPFGTFRYLRMPFGVKNGPATFQRLIDTFKRGLDDVFVLAYLDDLIVLSPSFEKHIADLTKVFERLRQFKLRANREKCVFARSEIRYLGHLITRDGISVDSEKTDAIAKLPAPRTVKELQSFLQTCSWYRRFIANFSDIARPLSNLTRKKVTWTWGADQQAAFEKLKHLLTTTPVLKQVDPSVPFIIRTDASSYALGAVLLQGEKENEHPIEYASRLLTKPEQNYSTTEREALAVVWALQKFRGYVEGSKITIATDHQPLRWLLRLKSPTGRLARWALQLQSFDINVEYVSGKQNVVADLLSRPPNSTAEDSPDCDLHEISIELPRRTAEDIREHQLQDPELMKIIHSFESDDDMVARWTERGYLMANGILYRYSFEDDVEEAQLVVPAHERPRILREYHDAPTAGHYGAEKTYQKIAKKYYFTGMRRYVTEHVRKCLECQRYKATNRKPSGLLQTPAYARRFEIISVDLFGPLPETDDGFKWILIVEDTSTKWTELFALKIASAEECARKLIEEIFLRYGLPRKVTSDNGVQFVSAVMQQVCYILGVRQSFTAYYHPESNMVERKNRDLKPRLAMLVKGHHATWSDHLSVIRFAMNSTNNENTGYTAAYLTFGRELKTLDDVQHDLRQIIDNDNFVPQITPYLQRLAYMWHDARDTNERNKDRHKELADHRRQDAPDYKIGDRVLVTLHPHSSATKKETSKFHPKRDGPYEIIRQVSMHSYEVASPDAREDPLGIYHTKDLTPFQGGDTTPEVGLRKRGRPRKVPHDNTPRVPRTRDDNVPRGGECNTANKVGHQYNTRSCGGSPRDGARREKLVDRRRDAEF